MLGRNFRLSVTFPVLRRIDRVFVFKLVTFGRVLVFLNPGFVFLFVNVTVLKCDVPVFVHCEVVFVPV